jgi:hypothetical protein
MAVLRVKELHQRRRSTIRDGKLVHLRVWLAVTDDIHDGTAVALVADDGTNRIPFYKEQYPGRPTCLVSSIEANPVQKSGKHFEVQVEYTDTDLEAIPVHPLEREPDISVGASEGTAPYFMDCSDPPKPVTTSTGEAFDQFFERETGELTITYTSNAADFNMNEMETYSHTVNLDAVILDYTNVFAPGTLKLSPITAAKTTETWMGSEVTYYKRTCILKARRQGWRDKPLDVSLNETVEEQDIINGSTLIVKKLKPILDKSGAPVRKPYPLDGAGKRKPSATDKAAELDFKPYTEKPFGPLNFE